MFGSDYTLAVIYIDGLVDTLTINHSIMDSLTSKDYDEKRMPLTLQKSCPSSKPFLNHRRLAIWSIWNP